MPRLDRETRDPRHIAVTSTAGTTVGVRAWFGAGDPCRFAAVPMRPFARALCSARGTVLQSVHKNGSRSRVGSLSPDNHGEPKRAQETRMSARAFVGGVAAVLLFSMQPAHAVVEIQWWHAMQTEVKRLLEKLAGDFNQSQRDYKIVPTSKGLYNETLSAAILALRTRQQPAIVQVVEVATATMMAAKGAVYPVFDLMRDQGEPFDPAAYLPVVTGYYADVSGNLLSLPFNVSTPILYYNKDQFRQAGLDPERVPATWPEVEEAGQKLRAAGVRCGFTTHWPSWIHIENFSAWHNLPVA